MLVHEGDGERVLCMQSALISVTSVHSVDHVSHFLPGIPHRIFAFLSKLAANTNMKGKPQHEA